MSETIKWSKLQSNKQTARIFNSRLLTWSHLSACCPAGLQPGCYQSSSMLTFTVGMAWELHGSEEVIFFLFSQNVLPRYHCTKIPILQVCGWHFLSQQDVSLLHYNHSNGLVSLLSHVIRFLLWKANCSCFRDRNSKGGYFTIKCTLC